MSRNKSFLRKVCYIAAIALLLLPIAALSQPATVDTNLADGRDDSSPGGRLSQLRTQYNLAQARLGEIDPASETMKLASLGLRGVAANILWLQANHYKKIEDWDKLEATVNQIIRLQPNFVEVWDFQAHNLSYNVSVEFDDYRMRYEWVKKGINFLIEGTHYNRDEPGLLSQLGWFTGQKVGRADEQVQFRRLYAVDHDFHDVIRKHGINLDEATTGLTVEDPKTHQRTSAIDNWLTARLWYDKAVDAVTYSGKPIRGRSPLLFYSGAPMSRINGSAAMQKDGRFFEAPRLSWERALAEWTSYGNRELPTSAGFNIRLNDQEAADARITQAQAELEKICGNVKEKILAQKRESLSAETKAALDKPVEQRTEAEHMLVYNAAGALNVAARDYLDYAPREQRRRVQQVIDQIEEDQLTSMQIGLNRRIVNFEYWRTRCQAEKTEEIQQAHFDVYEADRMKADVAKWDEAKQKYEEAWGLYAKIFEKHPALMINAEAQDLVDSVLKYRDLLGQLDEPFPAKFVLEPLLKEHDKGRQLLDQVKVLQGGGETKPEGNKPADPKPSGDKPADPASPAAKTAPEPKAGKSADEAAKAKTP
ncbi:MAG TPA: hypothetical protein VFB80_07215 [Pirellulaceae bacterium]|nr:hypothetical protein [Pirellulaceae bacterium]